MPNQNLDGMTVEELTNLKEMNLAQIALNVAQAKVQADRVDKTNEKLTAVIASIDEAIVKANTPVLPIDEPVVVDISK